MRRMSSDLYSYSLPGRSKMSQREDKENLKTEFIRFAHVVKSVVSEKHNKIDELFSQSLNFYEQELNAWSQRLREYGEMDYSSTSLLDDLQRGLVSKKKRCNKLSQANWKFQDPIVSYSHVSSLNLSDSLADCLTSTSFIHDSQTYNSEGTACTQVQHANVLPQETKPKKRSKRIAANVSQASKAKLSDLVKHDMPKNAAVKIHGEKSVRFAEDITPSLLDLNSCDFSSLDLTSPSTDWNAAGSINAQAQKQISAKSTPRSILAPSLANSDKVTGSKKRCVSQRSKRKQVPEQQASKIPNRNGNFREPQVLQVQCDQSPREPANSTAPESIFDEDLEDKFASMLYKDKFSFLDKAADTISAGNLTKKKEETFYKLVPLLHNLICTEPPNEFDSGIECSETQGDERMHRRSQNQINTFQYNRENEPIESTEVPNAGDSKDSARVRLKFLLGQSLHSNADEEVDQEEPIIELKMENTGVN